MLCSIDGCEKPKYLKTFCTKHYQRVLKYGDPLFTKHAFRKCSINDCPNRHYIGGYCMKHDYRFRRYGDPLVVKNNFGEGDTPELKFWSRVAITANFERCWNWQGSGDGRYGFVTVAGKQYRTNRYAFLITNGHLSDDLRVRHTCDNPLCCNPKHLILGTDMDNTRDKIERGRMKLGSQTKSSKLHERDIPEIRRRIKARESMSQIASGFGVTHSTIRAIKIGRTWNHVKES